MDNMFKEIKYFLISVKYNLKNAYVLGGSFYMGIFSMILNNSTFYILWYFLMKTTGNINGWSSTDVFGMLGVSTFCFGFTHSFFYGVVELPGTITKGQFDVVLLSPRKILTRLAGMGFSITALGDLIMGLGVFVWYGITKSFNLEQWILFLLTIIFGAIVFLCVRVIVSLIGFYIQDGDLVSHQIFELFLRPGLYPGSMFPNKMKIFFMTIIPSLMTSAIPIDFIKTNSIKIFTLSFIVVSFWFVLASFLLNKSIKKYESGNFLR